MIVNIGLVDNRGKPETRGKRMRCLRLSLVATLIPSALAMSPGHLAAQWDIGGSHRELRGMRVVDVGTVRSRTERLPRLDAAGQRTLSRDSTWLEYDGAEHRCLGEYALPRSPRHDIAALVVSDDKGSIYVAALTTYLDNVTVDIVPARWVNCPAVGTSIRPPERRN